MPKKGIKLSPQTIQVIRNHLKRQQITQEEFARQLDVTLRTLSNWLSGKHVVDSDKLDVIIEVLGIGIEDLLGDDVPQAYAFHEETMTVVWQFYKMGLAAISHRTYKRIAELFKEHVSFVMFPRKGFFQTFKHDVKKGKNYYFQFWIVPETDVESAEFIISFTINDLIRIDFGEILVKKTTVEIKQYYQPSNYQVKRPDPTTGLAKVVVWFDEMSHTFVVVGNVRFKIVAKGRIPEYELKKADDIGVFWKHFFFHS